MPETYGQQWAAQAKAGGLDAEESSVADEIGEVLDELGGLGIRASEARQKCERLTRLVHQLPIDDDQGGG
jgi:hypothetical protein